MNPTPASRTAVIYLRVSTKEQAERGGETEGFSIPAQRDACLRKASAIGATVIEEFVDRGESARSAHRPELQRMLEFVRENSVSYAIVHKVDRLARNRVDDVEINVALSGAGVQLVSCSENIDETPSGMLLHGIMSSIAEFYSRNLATEARKGMRQKAKAGGTPGMAPFGYINTRARTPDGRELRTVEVDEDRADVVRWIFDAYGTGEWTIAQLRDELQRRGVVSLPRPNKPARPLAISHLHTILQNRYYVGVVTFEGVEYPGRHEPLVSEALWHRVQEVRTGRKQSGEKPRQHAHYLKGSVYCGQCGEIMGVEIVKNRQGLPYEYFYCLGRQKRKNGCEQRAVQIDLIEQQVEAHWRTVTLPEPQVEAIRSLVDEHIDVVLPKRERAVERARRKLGKLEEESEKLLQAHYHDAVPLDLMKKEQARIAIERAAAEQTLSNAQVQRDQVTGGLEKMVGLLASAHTQYMASQPTQRRLLNQAIFQRLWVVEDEIAASDLTPAFRRLLDDDLETHLAMEAATDSVTAQPDSTTDGGAASNLLKMLRFERPEGPLSWERKNPGPVQDRGSTHYFLVAGAGFEPATSWL